MIAISNTTISYIFSKLKLTNEFIMKDNSSRDMCVCVCGRSSISCPEEPEMDTGIPW